VAPGLTTVTGEFVQFGSVPPDFSAPVFPSVHASLAIRAASAAIAASTVQRNLVAPGGVADVVMYEGLVTPAEFAAGILAARAVRPENNKNWLNVMTWLVSSQ
jgi:hypothetical protein